MKSLSHSTALLPFLTRHTLKRLAFSPAKICPFAFFSALLLYCFNPATVFSQPDSKAQSKDALLEELEAKGGFLYGYSASLKYVSMSMEIKNFGTSEGQGFGGAFEMPLLYTPGGNLLPATFGFAGSLGVQLVQTKSEFSSSRAIIDLFYLNMEIPLNLGLYYNVLSLTDQTTLFSGLTLMVYYRPSLRITSQKTRTVLKGGGTDGLTTINSDGTADLISGGFGVELLFASVTGSMSRQLKKPGVKLDFFILPGDPFILYAGLGVVQYYHTGGTTDKGQ